ncbi:MAG: hypothetical protein K2M05_08870, partial [Paramuribaculum sp.]|nr:hypothetical protein [Paramuribaculum sp.]
MKSRFSSYSRRIILLLPLALLLLGPTGCSTTRRLPEGEILYTGVKKIAIQAPDSLPLGNGIAADVKAAVNVKPNNSLISPYLRYPFPLG